MKLLPPVVFGTPFIDRLSFTCHLHDNEIDAFARWAQFNPAVGARYASRIYGFRYAWTLNDGIRLDYGDKASGASKTGATLRIEYNPAKHNLAVVDGLLPFLLGHWNITRVDVAIDYPLDLHTLVATHPTLRRSGSFSGADRQTETVYLGARGGERYIRIYNKAREQEAKKHERYEGDWWRVEVEHRPCGGDPLPDGLFDGLKVVYFNEHAERLRTDTLAALRLVQYEPGYWQELPKAQRRRLHAKEAEVLVALDPAPYQAYRDGLDALRLQLETIRLTARGGVVPHASQEPEEDAD